LQGRRWLASSILLLVTAIWGATFVLVQDAIATMPPFTFIAIRFAFATLILLLPMLLHHKGRSELSKLLRGANLLSGFVLGALLFAGYALQTFSLLYTTSGKSGFLTGLSVTLVPLLAWLILGTRPTRAALLGVSVATIGLYLLAFVSLDALNPGDLLAFLCAIAFALQVVYTGKYSAQATIQHIVIVQLATVALLSGIAALFFEPWLHVILSAQTWQPLVLLALSITAVFATAFAFLAQTHMQRFMTTTSVALIFVCEPIFAAITDYLWNGTILSPRTLLGCVLILSGTLLTELRIPGLSRR